MAEVGHRWKMTSVSWGRNPHTYHQQLLLERTAFLGRHRVKCCPRLADQLRWAHGEKTNSSPELCEGERSPHWRQGHWTADTPWADCSPGPWPGPEAGGSPGLAECLCGGPSGEERGQGAGCLH